jgi:hypothetical protein
VDLDAGLEFIQLLKPLIYEWNRRDGQGEIGRKEIGFTAQDLLEVQETIGITIPNLVDSNDLNNLKISYGVLVPVLVKAVQDLNKEKDDLNTNFTNLKNVLITKGIIDESDLI